ncbi:MAG: gephyrin-like molybdotransferase Glp [Candidatus Geothermarchaeales archaeon]
MEKIKTRSIRRRGFKKLEAADEALKKFLKGLKLKPTPPEEVDLHSAVGRVLAEDIVSPVDVPPFDRASMDGYAVVEEAIRGAVVGTPTRLRVVGKSLSGHPFPGRIGRGEAVEIATGARMPNGADAVVMYEFSKRFGGEVEIYRPVPRWGNVSRRGEDVKRGNPVLKAGRPLTPFDLALLASLGVSRVRVRKKPVIALIAVGEELVDIGQEERPPDAIIETNRLMLNGLTQEFGGEPLELGIVGDETDEVRGALTKALMEADAVVITGGTSIGERDLVPELIDKVGEIIVHGVNVRPGKPLILARVGEKPVICLPGYPVAAAVDFLLFVRPVVEKLLGVRGRYLWRRIHARTSKRIPSKPGIRHFVRVKLEEEDGVYHAHPIRIGGAGVLSSLTEADGFVVVDEKREGVEKGEEVDVLIYRRYIDEQAV